MIKRLEQVYNKFLFCLRITGGLRSFLLLVANSKRFNRFQKKHFPDSAEKQGLPVRYNLQIGGKKHTVYLRTYAGDIKMFYEIFWEQVYRLPSFFPFAKSVIIDAGSNIGMTGLYFSVCFPNANIYCIEPIKENFHLLKINLEEEINNDKVYAVQAALHSKDGTICMNDQGWAYNASIDDTGVYSVPAIAMNTFLKNNRLERIDLLKIDIEGAEKFVFLSDTGWLQIVNAVLIEIHSQELIEGIKAILLRAGFYWYEWNFTQSSGNLFFASKTAIAAGQSNVILKC